MTGTPVNDGDPDEEELTASVVEHVQHGALTLYADGSFAYVPDAGFAGTDSFT